jgi:hypothetical protein
MAEFGILVKSYANDLEYVRRLMVSIERHNVDGVAIYLVVPDSDLALFEEFSSTHVTVLPEERFKAHLTDSPAAGFAPGYINQEIVKLCFWESGYVDNYLCLDSDAEFIRDFHISDFMVDSETPYTFLSEDSELLVEPEYYANTWQFRAKKLEEIKQAIGVTDPRLLTVHGHAVFSAKVLRSFKENFLDPRGWDYLDAVSLSPYEPTWYSMWLQHDRTIPIHAREPIIKTFHNATQHLEYVLRGVTMDDVARGYVAVVVNSNYSRGDGVLSLNDSPHMALASYVTTRDLIKAMRFRSYQYVVVERGPFRKARVLAGKAALRIPGLRNLVDVGAK